MTDFWILGPVEAWSEGQRLQVASGKSRSILAILLLTPGMVVSAEALIDRLWGDRPPAKAREDLSAYVTRLRRSLRPGGDEASLAGRAGGYVLNVDPNNIDLHQFRQLRRRAGSLAGDDEKEQAASLAQDADTLWRGAALADIRGDWIMRMRDTLEEERRALLADRVIWELELGRHATLAGELTGLLARYPLDEILIACQMTALYRCGRPGDALRLYRQTRDRLVDEQGAEPGQALADLHQQILRRDPALAASRRSRALATPQAARVAQDTLHRGDDDLDLDDASVAVVIPGQVTRSSMADLASPEITAAFERSYRALQPRHQLFLRRIGLSPAPGVSTQAAALASVSLSEARVTLGILVDQELVTPGPDGRHGFRDAFRRLAAVRAAEDDAPQERRQAVGQLLDYYLTACDQASQTLFPLQHHGAAPPACPPGIVPSLASAEQAGAWLESEWQDILLAARYAAAHRWPRQCADLTFAVTGWLEARGYWDEAITACTVALQACRELDDPARIARASLGLAAISQQAGRRDTASGLAEDAAVIYRSLGDQRGLAQALDQIGLNNLRGGHAREALAYFAESRALLDEAGDAAGTATALNHSAIACWHLGRYPDAMRYLRDALTLYRLSGDERGEAKTLSNLGKMQVFGRHFQDALLSFTASLDIFARIGGEQSQAILQHNIGDVHYRTGSHSRALAAYHQALAIYRHIGDLPDEADLHNDIAAIYRDADLHDEALGHYHQASQIAQQIGHRPVQIIALRGIADLRRHAGRHGEALQSYHAAIQLARQIGDPYEEARILSGIAETAIITRDPHTARVNLRQALDIFERLGVPEAEPTRLRLDGIRKQPATAAH